jgi:hypothetical protein
VALAIMNISQETHFAWTGSYILLVSLVQYVLVAYWWRNRTDRLPLMFGGLATLALWSMLLFIPFESHTMRIELPAVQRNSVEVLNTSASAITTFFVGIVVVGINQLILIGTRRLVNRKQR